MADDIDGCLSLFDKKAGKLCAGLCVFELKSIFSVMKLWFIERRIL
jgi:hypothetical protein